MVRSGLVLIISILLLLGVLCRLGVIEFSLMQLSSLRRRGFGRVLFWFESDGR